MKTLVLVSLLLPLALCAQPPKGPNAKLKAKLQPYYTPDYLWFKNQIMGEFHNATPGRFGVVIKDVFEDVADANKVIAFTFDACIGKSNDYNAPLIAYLKKEHIPATLFVSGLWIDDNLATFRQLAADSLFEIGNHGLLHRLCSVDGETKYGIAATQNVGEVIDEMELNSRKIEKLTGKRPRFFRSATAYTDETCARIANQLGMQVVAFDVLSGDAVPFAAPELISQTIISQARPGAIVIMHFNHPQWHELQALQMAIPVLRAKGYKFVKLTNEKLVSQRGQ
ncbi:polysaccharide deacetylase family protein [Emticicia sp. 21SJ11W-3]|uniref:polysaccharide deacetylase family protein n=1 Tax=Emticicia sp. 21SJ11W-3 TaxID=2916755 RepID=UPI0020A211CA|nr:polysaccharide deacetylase family protein [Emticicia sp. 21SJ11W-3]UTA66767.1 polysaccharide deacetylase family protein [Emticicia sp. 21SJ11W-3]